MKAKIKNDAASYQKREVRAPEKVRAVAPDMQSAFFTGDLDDAWYVTVEFDRGEDKETRS